MPVNCAGGASASSALAARSCRSRGLFARAGTAARPSSLGPDWDCSWEERVALLPSGMEIPESIFKELAQGNGTAWVSTAWPRSGLASSGHRAAVRPDSFCRSGWRGSRCPAPCIAARFAVRIPPWSCWRSSAGAAGLKLQSPSLVVFILSFHPALVKITLRSDF